MKSPPPARTPAERAAALLELIIAAMRGKPAPTTRDDDVPAQRPRAPLDPLLN